MSEVRNDVIRIDQIMNEWLRKEDENEDLDLQERVILAEMDVQNRLLAAARLRRKELQAELAVLMSEIAPALAFVGRPVSWRDRKNRQDYVLRLSPMGGVVVEELGSHGELDGHMGPRPARAATLRINGRVDGSEAAAVAAAYESDDTIDFGSTLDGHTVVANQEAS